MKADPNHQLALLDVAELDRRAAQLRHQRSHLPELAEISTLEAERTELTDRMLIFGERHLRQVLAVYAGHYNTARPHRALGLRPPRPTSPVPEPIHCRIRRRPILGGLLNEYEAAA